MVILVLLPAANAGFNKLADRGVGLVKAATQLRPSCSSGTIPHCNVGDNNAEDLFAVVPALGSRPEISNMYLARATMWGTGCYASLQLVRRRNGLYLEMVDAGPHVTPTPEFLKKAA